VRAHFDAPLNVAHHLAVLLLGCILAAARCLAIVREGPDGPFRIRVDTGLGRRNPSQDEVARTDKKQGWPVCESAGGDAHTTADLEIGATDSSPVGRQRRRKTEMRSKESLH